MPPRRDPPLSQRPVPDVLRPRVRTPAVVVLGSPAEVVNLLSGLGLDDAVCYQMDLHQADRLRVALADAGLAAKVVTASDLWDLGPEFETALYMPARGGERELKIDMVEQAFHVLRPKGALAVWSPYAVDDFLPPLLKKVFGKAPSQPGGADNIFLAQRDGDRPLRRHEVTFQARVNDGPSCRFVSRPGTFSYGRFDNGARALAETMEVGPGDQVLDVGCGAGTNGVFAWQRCGPDGAVTFVDSNLRAVALADLNAQANGVARYRTEASASVEGLEPGSFDVALANPPYFAAGAVARLFIERSKALLRPGGRLFLVTRQPDEVARWVVETFGEADAVMHRGYTILIAEAA
jgi:16S rRNA (guanine1207-N2)-methyltransferase